MKIVLTVLSWIFNDYGNLKYWIFAIQEGLNILYRILYRFWTNWKNLVAFLTNHKKFFYCFEIHDILIYFEN